MKKVVKLLAVIGLLMSVPLLANVAIPSLYQILGFSSKANGITIIGFVLELLCVCIMARVATMKIFGNALFCTISMNVFSVIVGLMLRLPFAALIASLVPGQTVNLSSFQVGFSMLIAFVVVNTLLEGYLARELFYPNIPARRFWFWIMMANLLSNGTGLWLANSYMKVF